MLNFDMNEKLKLNMNEKFNSKHIVTIIDVVVALSHAISRSLAVFP